MDKHRAIYVLGLLGHYIERIPDNTTPNSALRHELMWRRKRAIEWLCNERRGHERAMRWLGYIEGTLQATGFITWSELNTLNRATPTIEEVQRLHLPLTWLEWYKWRKNTERGR